jgi:hypothetical protein
METLFKIYKKKETLFVGGGDEVHGGADRCLGRRELRPPPQRSDRVHTQSVPGLILIWRDFFPGVLFKGIFQ